MPPEIHWYLEYEIIKHMPSVDVRMVQCQIARETSSIIAQWVRFNLTIRLERHEPNFASHELSVLYAIGYWWVILYTFWPFIQSRRLLHKSKPKHDFLLVIIIIIIEIVREAHPSIDT